MVAHLGNCHTDHVPNYGRLFSPFRMRFRVSRADFARDPASLVLLIIVTLFSVFLNQFLLMSVVDFALFGRCSTKDMGNVRKVALFKHIGYCVIMKT